MRKQIRVVFTLTSDPQDHMQSFDSKRAEEAYNITAECQSSLYCDLWNSFEPNTFHHTQWAIMQN